jgi:hypothetical protein
MNLMSVDDSLITKKRMFIVEHPLFKIVTPTGFKPVTLRAEI